MKGRNKISNSYTDIKNLKIIMDDTDEFAVEKIKKLNKIVDRGINLYRCSVKKVINIGYIRAGFMEIGTKCIFKDKLFTKTENTIT